MMVVLISEVAVAAEVAVEAVVAEAVAVEAVADSIDLLSRDHQKKYEHILLNMSHYFIFFH